MRLPFIWRHKHEEIVEQLLEQNAKLKTNNSKLLLDLIKAQKNDSPKDPKSGRFTKNVARPK